MYNPRNSFIPINSTYPSTLSSNPALNAPPTPPASPRHPARLHRSSKRHLRTSASVASLEPIDETEQVGGSGGARREVQEGNRRENVEAIPNSLRPSSMVSSDFNMAPVRPTSANTLSTRTVAPTSTRPSSAQPISSRQGDRIQPKQSTERMRSAPAPQPQPVLAGLALSIDKPNKVITQIKPVQAIAQPKRPKPIDVNPKKESMADEWERELIHSARKLHITMPQQQASGKGKGKGNDVEWERAGTWQEDDPIREAEDRSRRDVKGERAFPPERPRAPIRAGSNGVTSVHIGVRPRLHPSRADTSMNHNQPDETLPFPLGSPLSDSQAQNLASGSGKSRFTDEKLQKAQAEYEEWLAKKEERESGVGHPHDYSTKDWVAKGRVPARPAALDTMGESSTMAMQIPASIPRQVRQPNRAPVSAPQPIQAPAPIPILVHADPDVQQPIRESVLVTPVSMVPSGQAAMPQGSHDPAYLGEPQHYRNGNLSSQPSMDNMHAQYMHGQDPSQTNPYALPPGMDPMTAWQYQYPYPYDPSYGYNMDPAMYQYWNPSNTWYGAPYNPSAYEQGGEAQAERVSKVHFEDTPSGADGNAAVKGMDPFAEDQYDP